MMLHSLPDKFYIQKTRGGPALRLSRTGAISISSGPLDPAALQTAYTEPIDALIGIAHLQRGPYLIVATASVVVATLPFSGSGRPAEIRRLVDAKIIPFSPSHALSELSKAELHDEEQYVAMLSRVLLTGAMHFAHHYDLTLSAQRIIEAGAGAEWASQPMWQRADDRFFWNRSLSEDLVQGSFHDWITPLVNGYISSKTIQIGSASVQLALVSRRSCHRAGRRFTTRGIDSLGNVANFAETEQIVIVRQGTAPLQLASFLQVRGSIPLFWEQVPSLKYTPPLTLTPSMGVSQNDQAFQLHIHDQAKRYNRVVMVNLVNQKGREGMLESTFSQQVQRKPHQSVRYVAFDFHKECQKMKYENLGKLMTSLSSEFAQMGYFAAEAQAQTAAGTTVPAAGWRIQRTQQGVIRTNCIDCLDRTNVAQSEFAKAVLLKQLTEFGVPLQASDLPPVLLWPFKHTWADNADALSNQYAGSGALKTDFTRTGKRSLLGAMDDGRKSLQRYFVNNLADGHTQDAVDLFLGHFRPRESTGFSPFRLRAHVVETGRFVGHEARLYKLLHQAPLTGFFVRLALVLAVVLLCMSLVLPGSVVPSLQARAMLLLILVPVIGFGLLATGRGTKYTAKPRFRAIRSIVSASKEL